jgi:hypothetical protein
LFPIPTLGITTSLFRLMKNYKKNDLQDQAFVISRADDQAAKEPGGVEDCFVVPEVENPPPLWHQVGGDHACDHFLPFDPLL